MRIHYNPELKESARYLRSNSTIFEILLWNKLKQRKMLRFDDLDVKREIQNVLRMIELWILENCVEP